MTIHVDDLQLAGSTYYRTRLHTMLTKRFGTLKRQSIPYTHAGIQLEWLTSSTLRLHQDKFCEALTTTTIPKHRLADPEAKCTSEEHKTFRSLTCGDLTQRRRYRSCTAVHAVALFSHTPLCKPERRSHTLPTSGNAEPMCARLAHGGY